LSRGYADDFFHVQSLSGLNWNELADIYVKIASHGLIGEFVDSSQNDVKSSLQAKNILALLSVESVLHVPLICSPYGSSL
jgi:hypothetical protein